MHDTAEATETIRVGISACLLGQKVRYDSGHKRDHYITQVLGEFFEFVPVCPEFEVGMGIPREAVRLVGSIEAPRMIGTATGADWTERMRRYNAERLARSDLENLSGYLLKKDSPSCGMERVKVYRSDGGMPEKKGSGLFAAALKARFPLLPIEEEGRLGDARLREGFIVRVFAYHRLRALFAGRLKPRDLVAFHTRHKMQLLAHSPTRYRELGRIVATHDKYAPAELRDEYAELFMTALAERATHRKHANVLQHMIGHLRDHLAADERAELVTLIDDYRRELIPLIVPLTLIRHHADRHAVAYLRDQVYLRPHPKEMRLLNHV
ncbi:MAG: YbgA family protein [Planctomycetota bacterium]